MKTSHTAQYTDVGIDAVNLLRKLQTLFGDREDRTTKHLQSKPQAPFDDRGNRNSNDSRNSKNPSTYPFQLLSIHQSYGNKRYRTGC